MRCCLKISQAAPAAGQLVAAALLELLKSSLRSIPFADLVIGLGEMPSMTYFCK